MSLRKTSANGVFPAFRWAAGFISRADRSNRLDLIITAIAGITAHTSIDRDLVSIISSIIAGLGLTLVFGAVAREFRRPS